MNQLEFALSLADQADRITMAHYQSADLVVTQKPDLTPVSEADQAVERMIRQNLKDAFPDDSILGEEYGLDSRSESESKGRQWIVDPIDGTKNFVRGVPIWATLIALAVDDEVVLGVASAPALGRRWWAAKAQGAWVSTAPALTSAAGSPQRLQVSAVSDLADASFAYASLEGWEQLGKLPGFLDLAGQVWRTRGYGDFWSYMLLAEGAVDLVAEPELEVYDMAALVPIVTEAGGTFTSLAGTPGPWGGNAIATNSHLHDAAAKYLSEP